MVRQRRDRCSTQRVGRKSNFTIIFASTAASQLLRCVQAIWAGKTAECEPKRQVQEQYPEQFHFHTHNHWSTPTSKEALIDRLFQIHIAQFMLAWTTRATLVDSPASSSLQPTYPAGFCSSTCTRQTETRICLRDFACATPSCSFCSFQPTAPVCYSHWT